MEEKNIPDIIVLSDKEGEYYRTINLTAMLDYDLSWKAKGLLYYIMTRPDNWRIRIDEIIKRSTNGSVSVRAGLKELEEKKYLYKCILRNKRTSSIVRWIYVSFPRPTNATEQDLQNLLLGNLNIGNLKVSYSNKNKVISLSKDKENNNLSDCPPLDNDSPPIRLTKDVKEIIDYWNSFGEPFTKHRYKKNSKTYKQILIKANKALSTYSKVKIKTAIEKYHKLYLLRSTKLIQGSIYYPTKLDEFIEFGSFSKIQIRKQNLQSKNKEDKFSIKSWLKECMKKESTLQIKYTVVKKDKYPELTERLKELWEDNFNSTIKATDENTFINASKLVFDFINDNQDKLLVSKNTIRMPSLFAHYVFDAIKDNSDGKKRVHPGWLVKDFLYDGILPSYLEKINVMEK